MKKSTRRLGQLLRPMLLLQLILLVASVPSLYASGIETVVAQSEDRIVTGTVVDEDGETLIGVSVIIKGTDRGVITDLDGRFSVRVHKGEHLLALSYIGMIPMDLDISDGRDDYRVVMKVDHKLLDEVVVTGYQTLSKERVTGSFATLDADDLQAKLQPDIISRVAGSVPGLQVDREGGLSIRGISTLSEGVRDPLIVVDGMPFEGSVSDLDPSLITKVTVLRDAAAASIYGARAANGVIVINTLEGGEGMTTIRYDGRVRLQGKPDYRSIDRLSTGELIDLQVEEFPYYPGTWEGQDHRRYMDPVTSALLQNKAGLLSAAELEGVLEGLRKLDHTQQLDDYYLRPAVRHQHTIALSGGTEKQSYMASVNYMGDYGNEKYSGEDRLGFSLKNTTKFLPWLTADVALHCTFDRSTADLGAGSFGSMLARPSYVMLFDDRGTPLPIYGDKSEEELLRLSSIRLLDEHYYPTLNLELEQRDLRDRNYRLVGGLHFGVTDDLSLDVRYQMEDETFVQREDYLHHSYFVATQVNNAALYDADADEITYNVPLGGQMSERRGDSRAWTFRTQVDYRHTFAEEHDLAALAGFEARDFLTTFTNTYYMGFDRDNLSYTPVDPFTLQEIKGTQALDGRYTWSFQGHNYIYHSDNRFVSFYANADYTYRNNLNLSGSIRIDQSNLFGTDPKYQYRPLWSLGASYDLSRTKALIDLPEIERLKLRATYGIGGNIPKEAGPYLILSSPSYDDYLGGMGSSIQAPPNKSLRWERTATTNVGVDFALRTHRISGSLDLYNKTSTDLLAQREIDPTLGHERVLLNYGAMYNRGVELMLKGDILRRGDFSWDATLVFSYNKNKLTRIENPHKTVRKYTQGGIYEEGKPASGLYSYRYAGLSHENGLPQYYDKEGSVVDFPTSLDDLVYEGTLVPPFTSSLSTSLHYGDLSLLVMLSHSGGNVMRAPAPHLYDYAPTSNVERDVLHRWQKPGDEQLSEVSPAIAHRTLDVNKDLHPWYTSDRFAMRADYLKLTTLTLSYSLPRTLLEPLGLRSASVTLQGDDLFLIPLNAEGLDPRTVASQGYGWGARVYKPVPTYNLGVSVTF